MGGRSPARRSRGRSSDRRGRSRSRRKRSRSNSKEADSRKKSTKWDLAASGSVEVPPPLEAGAVPPVASSPMASSPVAGLSAGPNPLASTNQHLGPPKHTIDLDQRFISGIIGKQGELVRNIEKATGCVAILEPSADSKGTVCQVYGAEAVAQMGADMIRLKVANVSGAAAACMEARESLEMEHAHVWKMLGKDGEDIKSLEADTGATITFEREKVPTSEGVDELHVMGRKDQVEVAMRVLQKRLDEILTTKFGPDMPFCPDATREIQVEQQFIGWIMGKKQTNIKQIAEQTGASMTVKQATKSEGHSMVRIAGTQQAVSAAFERISQRIENGRRYQDDKRSQFLAGDWLCPGCGDQNFRKNETCRRCQHRRPADGPAEVPQQPSFLNRDCDEAFQLEQQYVGYIIGQGGKTFKEIKEKSGAKIFIDQTNRDQGYSIVRVGDKGSPENLLALTLIEDTIEACIAQKVPVEAAPEVAQNSAQVTLSTKAAGAPPPHVVMPPGHVVPPPPPQASTSKASGPPPMPQLGGPLPPPPQLMPAPIPQVVPPPNNVGMDSMQSNTNAADGEWDVMSKMKSLTEFYTSDPSWNAAMAADTGVSKPPSMWDPPVAQMVDQYTQAVGAVGGSVWQDAEAHRFFDMISGEILNDLSLTGVDKANKFDEALNGAFHRLSAQLQQTMLTVAATIRSQA